MIAPSRIRNFCIVAHIDHGKSTLADRLLEITKSLSAGQMRDQVLDTMDLERERGITIKAHAITMSFADDSGEVYTLNLIDTPGHVDFSYEVSRSMAACEGALLVVDASQGVEAQTVSNYLLACESELAIVPVINKIDVAGSEVDEVVVQLCELLGCEPSDVLRVSARTGEGIKGLIEAIIARVPPPRGQDSGDLSALVFDSVFDQYRGVIAHVRVMDGSFSTGDKIVFASSGKCFQVEELGTFRLGLVPQPKLSAGQVGYVLAGMKRVSEVKIGDTIMKEGSPGNVLPGYREIKPMVFSGLYPSRNDDYESLREALEKLRLNDSALFFEPEVSSALGFGFRAGFLGMLHLEIVQERLEREYGIELIATKPNVMYKVALKDGTYVHIDSPSQMPHQSKIDHIEEPFIMSQILSPAEYVGNIMKLASERRGRQKSMEYLGPAKVLLTYEFPLSEIATDFYDKLKSCSKGFASFDYDHMGFRSSQVVKLDLMINGQTVDALSTITHQDKAYSVGKKLTEALSQEIPRQLFEAVIQAAVGSRIIARTSVRPLRKNVTAKCYGGDITRKRKLLEKQREGKKRMKKVGKIEIPQEAFMAVLKA
jgi:GTP-binding protein LepA